MVSWKSEYFEISESEFENFESDFENICVKYMAVYWFNIIMAVYSLMLQIAS